MANPRFDTIEEPPKRGLGVALMVIAVLLGLLALAGLVNVVNAAAYRVGASTEVDVTVTEVSDTTLLGAPLGTGTYQHDGATVDVRLAYVDDGETVTVGLPVLSLPVIGTKAYPGVTAAREDLYLLVGVIPLTLAAVTLFRRGRGHYTGAVRVTRKNRGGD